MVESLASALDGEITHRAAHTGRTRSSSGSVHNGRSARRTASAGRPAPRGAGGLRTEAGRGCRLAAWPRTTARTARPMTSDRSTPVASCVDGSTSGTTSPTRRGYVLLLVPVDSFGYPEAINRVTSRRQESVLQVCVGFQDIKGDTSGRERGVPAGYERGC